jgi:hypothetical protein
MARLKVYYKEAFFQMKDNKAGVRAFGITQRTTRCIDKVAQNQGLMVFGGNPSICQNICAYHDGVVMMKPW